MLTARARWRHLPAMMAGAYLLLLCFPQVLFAHQLSYRNLGVYSREPLDESIYDVLDRVESRLAASGINGDVRPRIFLTNGFDTYALMSLYVGSNSFGKGYAALPRDHVFINKAAPVGLPFVFAEVRDAAVVKKAPLLLLAVRH